MAFCRECGHQIHVTAPMCPQCGAVQNFAPAKNQTVAVLLAAFLGGLGIHRFYLGKTITGVLYLLFCWTGIPSLISFVEAGVYAFQNPRDWAMKYNQGRPGDVVPKLLAIPLLLIPFIVFAGIVAAIVVPATMSRGTTSSLFHSKQDTDKARVLAARQDIEILTQSLKLYRLDNTRYPTTEQGLQALTMKPTTGPNAAGWKQGGYIDRLPRDPWGNPYQYLYPGIYGEVDVFSLGEDGQPGGTGIDADIGSWDL